MATRVLLPFRHPNKLQPYADAVRAAGLEPVTRDVSQGVDWLDEQGLVLLGGTDLNPSLYGEQPHEKTEEPDDARDRIELNLIRRALDRNLPILAICRGLQILNVAYGGTLIQHLSNEERHVVTSLDKGAPAHTINIAPGTLLAGIARTSEWQVNSRHHQAVKTPGSVLRITARDSSDGTIEALEDPSRRYILGIQWHPEDQLARSPDQLRLFTSFAAALSEPWGPALREA